MHYEADYEEVFSYLFINHNRDTVNYVRSETVKSNIFLNAILRTLTA